MDEDERALPVTLPVGCLQLWNGSAQLLHFQRGMCALLKGGILTEVWGCQNENDVFFMSVESECFAQTFKDEFAFEVSISINR